MKNKFPKNYDPNYVYNKKTITIDKTSNKYPIIEKTNNADLFPLCPQKNIDD